MEHLAPQRLERLDLNEQVYEAVRELLVTGGLAPGSRLSLNQLAGQLGVSRSPVHQALTRLVAEGLVSVERRRGYYVTPLTGEAIVHAYDVRQALELHAAEVSVGRVSEDDLARLRELMEESLSTLDGDDFVDGRGYIRTNQEFHQFLVGLARNPLLSEICAGLAVNVLMDRIIGTLPARATGVANEHRRLVEAFERADLAAAQQVIRDHAETGKRIALVALENAGGRL